MARPILPHEAQIAPLRGPGPDYTPGVGNGPAKDTARFTNKRVEVVLAGAWDITIQGSIDGTTWTNIQANITVGSSIVDVPDHWNFMRVVTNVAADMSDYSVALGGLDQSAWE